MEKQKTKYPLNLVAILIFILYSGNLNAQRLIQLDESHFFYLNPNDEGKIDYVVNWNSEKVNLKPGNYIADNSTLKKKFKFTINKNGNLDGSAFVEDKKTLEKTQYEFVNGIMTKYITKLYGGQVKSTMTFEDSIYKYNFYDDNGILETEESFDLRLGKRSDANITTGYYPNGKISHKFNKLNKQSIWYYNNGNIWNEKDEKKGNGKSFSEDGRLTSQFYQEGDITCVETYYERDNGKLSSKNCVNDKEEKEYYYKNGELEYYTVFNKIDRKIRTYNTQGKEIENLEAKAR